MIKQRFLWCSPHTPTDEQMGSLNGTLELLEHCEDPLQDELANVSIDDNLFKLAERLLEFAMTYNYGVILQPAGSPAFQNALGQVWERMNNDNAIGNTQTRLPLILYAFSKRVSQDIPQEDGTVKKVSIFKHEGWVSV